LFKSRPLLWRCLVLLALPLLAGSVYTYRNLRASLPQGGSLSVDGLGAPVEIRRDAHGVPFIEARTDADAFFAAGYVHAQDRLWQLELQRRMVDGRLSEVFGRTSISNDIWLRTLGLNQAARAHWKRLSPEAQASLTAYAAGINAFLAEKHPLPPEFGLLGVEPQPWTVYDSLAWNHMFALTLGGNFREEISRFVAAQYLPPAKLAALYPGYPADAPVTVTTAERTQAAQSLLQLADLQQKLESDLKLGGKYVGSNGWVVSGKLTANGQSILANDPHLALQAPSLWYAMRLKGDKINVAGMTLVGLPVIIFGQNGDVAWGGTNMMADQQDLYFERVNPQDPTQYEVNGKWEKFTTRSEEIKVKNEFPAFLRGPLKPIEIEVRGTRHGPVISDQFHVFDEAVSLRWPIYDDAGSSYEGFYRVNYARDWQTFNAAFANYVAPALNLLYSDRHGNIGYAGVGKIPLRAKGNGTLPVPGWNDDYGWTGAIPFAEMPRSFNPEKGYIVNANNRITADDYPYFISHGWAPKTRASRIQELLGQKLAANKRLTIADMQAIQGDVANEPSKALVSALVTVGTGTDQQREAVRTLKQWNGSMDRNSVGAALYYVWTSHLREEIFSDELQGPWNQRDKTRHLDSLSDQMTDEDLAVLLRNDKLGWCDVRQTDELTESCEMAMGRSLKKSLRELEKMHGSDMSDWSWGEVHKTRYEHTPFSQSKLAHIFDREIANGGAPNSVNVASARYRDREGYIQTFGAGFRQIISLGPAEQHLYMNSTGQSGNVMSEHYDDMVEPFRDVLFYPLPPTAPQAGAVTLQLKPRS
jgi:penicillin G amidase